MLNYHFPSVYLPAGNSSTAADNWTNGFASLVDATSANQLQELLECLNEINQLADLANDWNGYGALAISKPAIVAANGICEKFMSMGFHRPEITPKSAGTIGFSWELDDVEAYLEVGETTFSAFIDIENFEPEYFGGKNEDFAIASFSPLQKDSSRTRFSNQSNADIRISFESLYGHAA